MNEKRLKKKIDVEQADKSQVYGAGKWGRPKKTEQNNIYLIGLRGSGKTTVGKQLAKALSRPFVDTDDRICEAIEMDIQTYVEQHGWEAFREMEQRILLEVIEKKDQIVATGGGVVLSRENRERMKSTGNVFYLMADVDVLLGRLTQNPKSEQRPALTDLSLREELAKTLHDRDALYMEAMDYILIASHSPEELTTQIMEMLKDKD